MEAAALVAHAKSSRIPTPAATRAVRKLVGDIALGERHTAQLVDGLQWDEGRSDCGGPIRFRVTRIGRHACVRCPIREPSAAGAREIADDDDEEDEDADRRSLD